MHGHQRWALVAAVVAAFGSAAHAALLRVTGEYTSSGFFPSLWGTEEAPDDELTITFSFVADVPSNPGSYEIQGFSLESLTLTTSTTSFTPANSQANVTIINGSFYSFIVGATVGGANGIVQGANDFSYSASIDGAKNFLYTLSGYTTLWQASTSTGWFSVTAVPLPGAGGVGAAGLLVLAGRRRR